MDWKQFNLVAGEIFYVLIAIIFVLVGLNAYKTISDSFKKKTTLAFWLILAFTFAVGPHVDGMITGIAIIILAILTGIKGVVRGEGKVLKEEETRQNADRIGYKIFLPALTLAVSAVLLASFLPKMAGAVVLGFSGLAGLIVALLITRANISQAATEGVRLMDNVSTTGILPQLLTALGAVFTAAGVGEVISSGVSSVIPEGSKFVASAVYCIGMALFTIIMGNGFAAFSVITVGIGIPFLIMQGANPAVVGALGLTAGYCGTLVTPMAANFNIMPAALLETKDQNAIIKAQAPFALCMLIIHILLVYFLAF
ncbi:MAG: DUF979 domain-containing protein [Eubacteriales bacterium]|nr:DUF979 domain-containing protein [Clostridiales bacterium]MDY5836023.1 DUF979 domain-containing protein [Eubacteriales bacterium]